ncbi:MAG: hypothetical protein BMS9Abin31_0821 [Gammaproteobacteria bacterium]|nr:MAG: hypothetical protein BMS9Abin31_0821 [Gammaproteobacteria bacterium]
MQLIFAFAGLLSGTLRSFNSKVLPPKAKEKMADS